MAVHVRTDVELLARVARRDSDAFEELYERFSRPIYSLCLRMLADRGHAEDAAQEAFAAIWRAAAVFDPDRGSPLAWMLTIARNAATDVTRRRTARPVDDMPDQPDPSPALEESAIATEQAFRVHVAIDGLAPVEREVIELAYFGGLSQSEIASRLQTPLGTVKTRTRRALRNLASVLGGER